MKKNLYVILFCSAENDIFTLSDKKTFDSERRWLDRSSTRMTNDAQLAMGFRYYTDFQKAGFEFFRVCHDVPQCPLQ